MKPFSPPINPERELNSSQIPDAMAGQGCGFWRSFSDHHWEDPSAAPIVAMGSSPSPTVPKWVERTIAVAREAND